MAVIFFCGVGLLVWVGLPFEPPKVNRANNRYSRDAFIRRLPVMLENTERREGLLYRPGSTTPFKGEVIERYGGGALKSVTEFVGGRVHGWSVGYHSNGQVQIREQFSNGVAHGVRTKFYVNGSTQSVARIVGGQLNGPFLRWHGNGQLAQEVMLTNGLANGLSRAWHENGQLKARVLLAKGKVIEQQLWSVTGEEMGLVED